LHKPFGIIPAEEDIPVCALQSPSPESWILLRDRYGIVEIFICSSSPISWIETIKLDTIGKEDDEEDGDL
jgi:hypothetical protein